jgi:hypothetical protein
MASNGPDRAVQWIRDSWTEVVPGRYRFEKFLGGGARGRAWLIQELNDGNPVRRFVVKYADDDIGVPTVEKEIRFLRVSSHLDAKNPEKVAGYYIYVCVCLSLSMIINDPPYLATAGPRPHRTADRRERQVDRARGAGTRG